MNLSTNSPRRSNPLCRAVGDKRLLTVAHTLTVNRIRARAG